MSRAKSKVLQSKRPGLIDSTKITYWSDFGGTEPGTEAWTI